MLINQVETWKTTIFRCSWCVMEKAAVLAIVSASTSVFSGAFALLPVLILKLDSSYQKPERCIRYALSLHWPLYNYFFILDTLSGNRTSSFVFQVSPTIDLTYLTRSVHASFKRLHWEVGCLHCPCWFLCDCQWFIVVSESVARIIFSNAYYFNMGPLRVLIPPSL